jgi:hypothetical protein
LRRLASSRTVLGFLFCLVWWAHAAPARAGGGALSPADLTRKIPPRPRDAMTGSEFASYVSGMEDPQREQAIRDQLLEGNLPEFLRSLKPVDLRCRLHDGSTITATIFVMPDYLAIGSADDFLRIPMNLHTASAIASQFGFILPTPKIVDAIYAQSVYHYKPQPLPAGPAMRSTSYYCAHDQKIKEQQRSCGIPAGELVSGHKKDVVITNRLAQGQDKIAIYGWHRNAGAPIQPLSTVHGSYYADYSHGIRLVSDTVWIGGELRSIYEVLEDPELAGVISSEGVMDCGRWIPPPSRQP